MRQDEFERLVLNGESEGSGPAAPWYGEYDPDGDCFEFLLTKREGHVAKRVDNLLTVYYSRDTGEIVGGLLKGIRKMLTEVLRKTPGFRYDMEGNRVSVSKILTVQMWQFGDDKSEFAAEYKQLRMKTSARRVEMGLQEA